MVFECFGNCFGDIDDSLCVKYVCIRGYVDFVIVGVGGYIGVFF